MDLHNETDHSSTMNIDDQVLNEVWYSQTDRFASGIGRYVERGILKKIHRILFQRDYTEILREIQWGVKKDEHR